MPWPAAQGVHWRHCGCVHTCKVHINVNLEGQDVLTGVCSWGGVILICLMLYCSDLRGPKLYRTEI